MHHSLTYTVHRCSIAPTTEIKWTKIPSLVRLVRVFSSRQRRREIVISIFDSTFMSKFERRDGNKTNCRTPRRYTDSAAKISLREHLPWGARANTRNRTHGIGHPNTSMSTSYMYPIGPTTAVQATRPRPPLRSLREL